MFYLGVHNYFEIAAFLTSVIVWNSIKSTQLHWFMPYLFFIVMVELIGRYIKLELHLRNGWLYNISVPIEYLFFSFMFLNFYRSFHYKKATILFLILFPLFTFINIFFVQGTSGFNSNLLKAGSFCMIIFCCFYFFELLRVETIIDPLKEPFFWIASGLLIFNVGEFVYIALSDTLFSNWQTFRSLVKKINHNLVYVLYSCIIVALLLSQWKQKKKN
jgi:hypothetical protein